MQTQTIKQKIKIKETGEITYCNLVIEAIGKENRVIPELVGHYYKDTIGGEEWDKDEIEIIPQEPYELFGIECGEGWKCLYQPLIDYIQNYNKDKSEDEQIQIDQIKEKWGGLRFYISHGPEELFNMIDKAESESFKICETCGSRERVGMAVDGWYSTVCHKCIKDWAKEQNRIRYWRENETNNTYKIFPDPDKEDEILVK